MRKSPGFVAAAVLTLALGIGANTAIFSLVDAVLVRPLPYPHPEQIVAIYDVQPNYGTAPMSYAEFADWRDKVQVFQTVAAQTSGYFVLSGTGTAEQVRVQRVSASYLTLFGVEPFIGRNLRAEEEPVAAPRVAMISYAYWKGHFGGDRNVLDQTLTLNDSVFSIVGVLPRDFKPLSAGDIVIGLRLSDSTIKDRPFAGYKNILRIYGYHR